MLEFDVTVAGKLQKVSGDDWDLSFDVAKKEAGNEYQLHCYSELINNATVLDIGAGYGEQCLEFINHGARKVCCYEPNPKVFEFLKRNASGLPNKITCVNGAVSNVTRKGTLYVDDSRTASGSIDDVQYDPTSSRALSRSRYEINVFDVNDIVANLNLQENEKLLIKMDCEGSEYLILPHLFLCFPTQLKMIIFEYHNKLTDSLLNLLLGRFANVKIEQKDNLYGLVTVWNESHD